MATEILVAIWNQAPFQGSIFRGIEELNSHLETKDIPVKFEPVSVKVRKPTDADIFILDGGEDVDPERYGQKNEYSYFSKARDKAEFSLTKHYANAGIRLSGICRGHQLLNVYFGGTLYQDIRANGIVKSGEGHSSGHKVFLPRQPRNLVLPSFIGNSSFTVSSLHHQAVADFGRNIRSSLIWRPRNISKSKSYYAMNIVEGIESSCGKIRGLQCHPEFRGYPKDGVLFAYLMHVDAFTREFVNIDSEKLEKKYGKQTPSASHYPKESSVPERPRAMRDYASTISFNTGDDTIVRNN